MQSSRAQRSDARGGADKHHLAEFRCAFLVDERLV